MAHIPVLLKETIEALDPKPGEFFIDGTLGAGGHAEAILNRIAPNGIFLGLDWSEEAVVRAEKKFAHPSVARMILRHRSYVDLPALLRQDGLPRADGLLVDLGLSTEELEESGRGFSFQRDEPLDMRFDAQEEIPTAADLVNGMPERELAELLKMYGEEPFAGRIARQIVEMRRKEKFYTTQELVRCIEAAVPRMYAHARLHPATRTFQALRIAVNRELENVTHLLEFLPLIVKSGGRVAVITFHSLEDKIVKENFKKLYKEKRATWILKKPIEPSRAEVHANPRSRSAKLRAIQLI